MAKIFTEEQAATVKNPKWDNMIRRQKTLNAYNDEIRSFFERDYTRILHCLAYNRLKHKTQVFFNTNNDHVCTRMEHVAYVESVSYTIAKELGLNTELTKAIAIGHDLGHAPFGHQGEKVIRELSKTYLGQDFWHEKNSLRFVDKIELLEDDKRVTQNLCLTYAVRDGIISHCGEKFDKSISPRNEPVDLNDLTSAAQCQPYTWEGCVVKIADKISYLGRDIEDALRLNFISLKDIISLRKIALRYHEDALNTTTIMRNFINDLCKNSTLDGLKFSPEKYEMLCEIKEFNYKAIYLNPKFECYRKYSALVLTEIFNALLDAFSTENILNKRFANSELYEPFIKWLVYYCDVDKDVFRMPIGNKRGNDIIYKNITTREVYIQAIIDYISGMTDKYAIRLFNSLVRF